MKRSRTINFQQFYNAATGGGGGGGSGASSTVGGTSAKSTPGQVGAGLRRSMGFTSALKSADSKSKLPPSPTSSQWTEGAFQTIPVTAVIAPPPPALRAHYQG